MKMTKIRQFAQFLLERKELSQNKTIYTIIENEFIKTFINDGDRIYLTIVKDGVEMVVRGEYRIENPTNGFDIMVTQVQEKSSTLKSFKINSLEHVVRYANLKDLLNHKII